MLRSGLAFALLLAIGCYRSHARDESSLDGGVPTTDASVDAPAVPPVASCEDALARLAAGEPPFAIACDPRTFPAACTTPLSMCCVAQLTCFESASGGSHVDRAIACNDFCPPSCLDHPLERCLLDPDCEIFDPGACGPAPPGVIEGPTCAPRRLASCDGNAPCLPPNRCVPFLINPCAGLPCRACGEVVDFCVP